MPGLLINATNLATFSLNYVLGDTAGGGQSIVITGVDLSSVSSVKFGNAVATVTNNTSTAITCTLPANSSGHYDVTLTFPDGRVIQRKNVFQYWSPLDLSGVDTYLDSNKGWSAGTWTDQKNSVDWSPGNAPSQSSNEFGTIPSISFNGTSNYLSAGAARDFSTDCFIAVVAKWTSVDSLVASTNNVPLTICGWSSNWCGFGASAGSVAVSSFNHLGTILSGVKTASSANNTGAAKLLMLDSMWLTDLYTMYVNLPSAAGSGSGVGYRGVDLLGVGRGSSDYFAGHLGAVIFVNGRTSSTSDRVLLLAWALQRFGVA